MASRAGVCPDPAPARLTSMRTASIAGVVPDYMARSADAGGEGRFERLIEPHLGDALALAQALSPDRSSAQDAVQSAALKAWRRIRQLRDDGSARAWFLTIVVNECKSVWRRRTALPSETEGAADPINWPTGIDERMDVRSAMRQLKRDDRVVLSLRFLMDLSVEEAAGILGISVSAVKARTARAASRFRLLMTQAEAGK
jgi:RNA polymerase sigma-70 factor (ECF subfamily)